MRPRPERGCDTGDAAAQVGEPTEEAQVGSERSAPPSVTWSLATALMAVATLAVHLSRVGWALDRTDEGQYLLLLSDPESSRRTVFLFGYVLHPIFSLVGGDILALRVIGALISVAAAGLLGWATTRVLGLHRREAWTVSGVAAAAGLGPLLYFPLTPSYNTLSFWGVCLWATGLVLALAQPTEARPTEARPNEARPTEARRAGRSTWRAVWPGVLMGLGGVVAGVGKVTTGLALAVLTVVALAGLVGPLRRRTAVLPGLVIGAAVSLTGVLLLAGHGPGWLAAFYREGARSVSLLQGHEHLVRWDEIPWDGLLSVPAIAVVVGAAVTAVAARRGRGVRAVGTVAAIAVVGVTVIAFATGHVPTNSPQMTAALWWIPLSAVSLLLVRTPRDAQDAPSGAARAVAVVCLVALPLAYVVGTNGNYWISQGRAGVFWFVAVVLLTRDRAVARRIVTVTAATLVLMVAVAGLGYAYRYEPMTRAWSHPASTKVAVVSPEGARLRVTAQDAETSRALARLARQHHLAGVPILDVTGASPGYIRQLGGTPVGSSWLLGGYPGSLDAALAAVRAENPQRLREAWVLDAPDSPRRIAGLLPALGRPVEDYEVVATFRHHLGYNVRLLRPVDASGQ